MVSDEYSKKVLSYTFRATELTAKVLLKQLGKFLKSMLTHKPKLVDGQQTLRQLERYKRQMASIEIPGINLPALKREFRAYSVDFAIHKDSTSKDTYTIYFKAQDTARIEKAVNNVLAGYAKPSILGKLKAAVDAVKERSNIAKDAREVATKAAAEIKPDIQK